MKEKAIIIDIDGTLANNEHRQHFLEGEKKDWKSFLSPEEFWNDTVNIWCDEIIDKFADYYQILFVTGRSDEFKEETLGWIFNKTGVLGYPIYMRKKDDFRSDTIIKKEIYENEIKEKYDVLFCVDDRSSVVQMWRSIGLTCLQCADGNC